MGATGNIARLEQRFLRELSLPFPFQPFSIARISIISSMISQTSRVNRIFFAPISFPPPPIGLFETLPVSNTENAGLLDDGFYSTSCFYSSPSVLNILPGDSVSIVILHELPFLRIACSRLKQSGTRRSTWSFLSKFLGVFDESYFLH